MIKLRIPQARLLVALMPAHLDDPTNEWPSMTTYWLAVATKTSPKSDYIRRALRGLPEGSSSGDAHDGLLTFGYVVGVELNIDGVVETHYRITPLGVRALQNYLAANKLPPLKDRETSINHRYKKLEETC